MKKRILIGLSILLVVAVAASVVWADDPVEYTYNVAKDSHKVKNKWDLCGTFISSRPWDGVVPVGSTWTYRFHIKEAMDGEYSVGSIHFVSGDVEVIAHVEATKPDYEYWNYPGDPYDTAANIAAVGTAEYNDTVYNFMFLHSEGAVWIALSHASYDSEWAAEDVWAGSARLYDLLSVISPDTYPLDPKAIH